MYAKIRNGILALIVAVLIVACGEPEPEFKLRDITGLMPELEFTLTRAADGETVTAADYEGGVTVLFFGFTHCPDICPATLARFKAARSQLEPDAAERVQVLFVSVDPQRDTLARLGEYVGLFGAGVTGLRGPQPELRELTKRYRVTYGYGEPDESGYYDVSHSSAAFVFDREGEPRLLVRGEDPIDAITHDLRVLAND